jgi:DNA polymerase III subunit epsilon
MSLREIVLDTETTGLSPDKGHRIVEIACAELIDFVYTGNHYHVYINPERDVPIEASNVHGLHLDFLMKHPVFYDHVHTFLDFVQDSPLVIHNAPFDMKFLNYELQKTKRLHLKNPVIDTLQIARKKFPGSPATLDALCKRFNIDLKDRTKHGALIDVLLLSKVYIDLTDRRVPSLGIEENPIRKQNDNTTRKIYPKRSLPLSSRLTEKESAFHDEFIKTLKGNPLWYL